MVRVRTLGRDQDHLQKRSQQPVITSDKACAWMGNTMKKSWYCFAFVAVVFLCQAPKASGSVGGSIGGGPNTCGSGGTLYANLTSTALRFELSLTNFSANCTTTISWTDTNGHAQTVDVGPNLSTVVSTSLPARGTVLWSSSGSPSLNVVLSWELERAPAQSVGVPSDSQFTPMQLYATPCGSAGTLYTNLTGSSVVLDLGVENGSGCAFTLSWTDAGGHGQTINLGLLNSQGVSTSVPAGGSISWSSASGGGSIGLLGGWSG